MKILSSQKLFSPTKKVKRLTKLCNKTLNKMNKKSTDDKSPDEKLQNENHPKDDQLKKEIKKRDKKIVVAVPVKLNAANYISHHHTNGFPKTTPRKLKKMKAIKSSKRAKHKVSSRCTSRITDLALEVQNSLTETEVMK